MPEDPKAKLESRLAKQHEVFSQDEVDAAGGPPPGYVVEPFVGNVPGESRFLGNRLVRLRKQEESQQESKIVGAAALGALSGGAGPAIMGAGGLATLGGAALGAGAQGWQASKTGSMGDAIGNAATQLPAELLTNTAVGMIPGGNAARGLGMAARMGVQGGAGLAQYAAEQAVANKVDSGNRPLTDPIASLMSMVGAGAQGLRDTLGKNFHVRNAMEAENLKRTHGVDIEALPKKEVGIENIDSTPSRIASEQQLGKVLGEIIPKNTEYRIDIPGASELEAIEKAAKTMGKFPSKLKVVGAETSDVLKGIKADAELHFSSQIEEANTKIRDLQNSRKLVKNDAAKAEIDAQILELSNHRAAVRETKKGLGAAINNRRPFDFTNEGLQARYDALLEMRRKEGMAKDFYEKSVPEAETAMKTVMEKRKLAEDLKVAIRPTGTPNAIDNYFSQLGEANFPDSDSLINLVTDKVLEGTEGFQKTFGKTLYPSDGVKHIMSRLQGVGEEAVANYRKVFFTRMLDKSLDETGKFRGELKDVIGNDSKILREVLRNPGETDAALASKVNDFQKFWNRVVNDAPGNAKGGWTSSLKQWVIFDLSSHLLGVAGAAAIAGGSQLFKMYRTADLLQAMAGLSPHDFAELTKKMNSMGPWRALHNNIQMREFMKSAWQKDVREAPADGLPRTSGPQAKPPDAESFDMNLLKRQLGQ